MSTTDALGAPGSKDADTPAASSLPAAPAASTPAAIREDQIANAVAFLTHPKVGSSSGEARIVVSRTEANPGCVCGAGA